MTRPGYPEREAALKRRSLESLIAEELRRLDPDDIYGETLGELPNVPGFVATPAPSRGGTFRQPDDSHDGTDDSAGRDQIAADAAARRRAPVAAAPARTSAPARKAAPAKKAASAKQAAPATKAAPVRKGAAATKAAR